MKKDKYAMNETVLLFDNGEPFRWESDKQLCYFGSVEDALVGLIKSDRLTVLPVAECSAELQAEYKQIIDNLEED